MIELHSADLELNSDYLSTNLQNKC